PKDSSPYREARGLIGRTNKQIYVDAHGLGPAACLPFLERAIESYGASMTRIGLRTLARHQCGGAVRPPPEEWRVRPVARRCASRHRDRGPEGASADMGCTPRRGDICGHAAAVSLRVRTGDESR